MRGIALSAALVGGGAAVVGATSPAGASTASSAATRTAHYTAICTITGFGSQSLSGSFTSTAPASVASGAQFSVTGIRITITVPAALVNQAMGLGVSSFSGTLTQYNMKNTDASPGFKNIAGAKGRPIAPTTLVTNQAATLSVPGPAASFSVGPFTAGAGGKTDFVTAGLANASITAFNSSGAAITTVTASCGQPTPRRLFTVTVT